MLKHLTISNYILIERLDIDFQAGFSVMTGETGAGKSIILGALGLLMGGRADTASVMPGAAKCIVEGIFDIEGLDMQALFEENGLDYDPSECILRREVSRDGKSRAFADDSPVPVAVLRKIGSRLLDIHSQHSNLLLENPAFQIGIVDTIASHQDLLGQYRDCYARIVQARRQLTELEESLAKRQGEEDYLRFQLEQLDAFKPQQGEDEGLKQLQSTLSHAGDIKAALSGVDALFNGSDGEQAGAIDALRRSAQAMQQVSKVFPAIEDYLNRIESVVIEIRDISSDLSSLAEDVEFNPARLQQVTERLDGLYALEQKHHVGSAEELIALADSIRTQLDALSNSEDDIQALRGQISKDTEQARRLAEKLSAGRTKAARQVEKLVAEALVAMDMPAARFSVSMEKHSELLPLGTDIVTFLFSANKSMAPRPLADVASGGEMSRVMLALKALVGTRSGASATVILDEIDTGVSGKVASSMAQIMSQMSSGAGQQVLAITHLPQIAAKGDAHYFVYKEDDGERTLTHIRKLDEDGRVTELAHLLSGSKLSEAALENAKQLLNEK